MTQRVLGVAGWKNSGKTTLTVRLVEELSRRGYRISTVKHAHHAFDIDHAGTDSFRHRAAGAGEVAIVSASRWALMHELRGEEEPSLDEVLARMEACDLVLVEGYKRGTHPKIEVRRRKAKDTTPLPGGDAAIIAVVADHKVEEERVPVFAINDVPAIASFIEKHFGMAARPTASA
jgi:molybdopterin-guanine dinucleotide biosynthesis adapter protein